MSWNRTTMVAGLLVVAACSAPKPTGELKIRVNEAHLAPVPMAQRQDVVAANEAVFRAEWQIKYTEIELSIAETDVKVAKNELEQAKLSAKSADTRQAHAQETADQNLIRDAQQLEKVAGLEISVAEKALAEAKQRVDFLKARLAAERLVHRREEARAELAKAKSMAAAGVRPPDFNAKKYESQYQERQRMAQSALATAQQEKKELVAIEQQLTSMKAQLQQAQKPAAALPMEDPSDAAPAAPELAPVGGAPTEPPAEGAPAEGAPAEGAPAEGAEPPTEGTPVKPGEAAPAEPTEAPAEKPADEPKPGPGTAAPGTAPKKPTPQPPPDGKPGASAPSGEATP